MKQRYLYVVICLLAVLSACDRSDILPEPEPDIRQGDALVLSLTRSGSDPAPDGDYGLFAVEYAYNFTVSWDALGATPFYSGINNRKVNLNSEDKLVFNAGSSNPPYPYRYPINDFLSVFLYYPYSAAVTPVSIPVAREVKKDVSNNIIADKYPDYLGGGKAISVIAGTPEAVPSDNTIVPLKHLMARVHFRIKNPVESAFTLTYVELKGITWQGAINPQIKTSGGFFTPVGSSEDLMLIRDEGVTIYGTPTGNTVEPQYIPIAPKYNYSDSEAGAAAPAYYDPTSGYSYYMLVPPLIEADLSDIILEITVSRSGSTTTHTIEMKQPEILTWEPGKSYCYTINFNSFPIEEVFGTIEDWLEDLFISEPIGMIP